MPASSLFLINPLGDLLEICCRSEMSRSSAKIRDHVVITLIPGADPPPLQREVIFSRLFVFPEFDFRNLPPALPCPPRAAITRGRLDPVEPAR
jgi:hypothetical protein